MGTKGTLCGKAVLRSMGGIFQLNEATCKECPRRNGYQMRREWLKIGA